MLHQVEIALEDDHQQIETAGVQSPASSGENAVTADSDEPCTKVSSNEDNSTDAGSELSMLVLPSLTGTQDEPDENPGDASDEISVEQQAQFWKNLGLQLLSSLPSLNRILSTSDDIFTVLKEDIVGTKGGIVVRRDIELRNEQRNRVEPLHQRPTFPAYQPNTEDQGSYTCCISADGVERMRRLITLQKHLAAYGNAVHQEFFTCVDFGIISEDGTAAILCLINRGVLVGLGDPLCDNENLPPLMAAMKAYRSKENLLGISFVGLTKHFLHHPQLRGWRKIAMGSIGGCNPSMDGALVGRAGQAITSRCRNLTRIGGIFVRIYQPNRGIDQELHSKLLELYVLCNTSQNSKCDITMVLLKNHVEYADLLTYVYAVNLQGEVIGMVALRLVGGHHGYFLDNITINATAPADIDNLLVYGCMAYCTEARIRYMAIRSRILHQHSDVPKNNVPKEAGILSKLARKVYADLSRDTGGPYEVVVENGTGRSMESFVLQGTFKQAKHKYYVAVQKNIRGTVSFFQILSFVNKAGMSFRRAAKESVARSFRRGKRVLVNKGKGAANKVRTALGKALE